MTNIWWPCAGSHTEHCWRCSYKCHFWVTFVKAKGLKAVGIITRVRPHLIMPAPKGVTQCKNQQFFSIFFLGWYIPSIMEKKNNTSILEKTRCCVQVWAFCFHMHGGFFFQSISMCAHTLKNLCEDNPNFTPSCVGHWEGETSRFGPFLCATQTCSTFYWWNPANLYKKNTLKKEREKEEMDKDQIPGKQTTQKRRTTRKKGNH